MKLFMQRIVACVVLAALPLAAVADWVVARDRSAVTYLSSKMTATFQTVFENNRFNGFSGGINDAGEVMLDIDLNSVDTGVEIRDERIRQYVFDVAHHPRATVRLAVGAPAQHYPPGRTQTVEAALTMRGVTRKVKGEISVARAGDSLVVQTTAPILVNAVDYGMLDGFGKLKELVGLFNIPATIPVSFKLVFVKR